MSPLLALFTGLALAEEPCDLAAQLDEAEGQLTFADIDGARSALAAAEKDLSCGEPATSGLFARFWMIEAAVLTAEGDKEGADDSWSAARRIEPELWLDGLGPVFRKAWESAPGAPEARDAMLATDAPTYEVWMDGRPWDGESIPGGLHAVQIVTPENEVRYGRVVYMLPGQTTTLTTSLPDYQAPATEDASPEPPEPEPEPPAAGAAFLAVGVGGQLALGNPLTGFDPDGRPVDEPGAKVLIPVEVGGGLRTDTVVTRVSASLLPIPNGRLLYGTDEGLAGSAFGMGGHLLVAASLGSSDLGGSATLLFPGRVGASAVWGLRPESWPIALETRLGALFPTERSPEPTVSVHVQRVFTLGGP